MSDVEAMNGAAMRWIAERLVLFCAAFVLWLLLTWPVSPLDGSVLWDEIAAGAVAAVCVALVMKRLVTRRFARLLDPRRYAWAVVYLFVFAYYAFIASLDVARRILHPAMPIRPGILRLGSTLRSDSARTLLATSITLTPGTLSVDLAGDGGIYVHWIDVSTLEREEAAKQILGRFEWFVRRIVE